MLTSAEIQARIDAGTAQGQSLDAIVSELVNEKVASLWEIYQDNFNANFPITNDKIVTWINSSGFIVSTNPTDNPITSDNVPHILAAVNLGDTTHYKQSADGQRAYNNLLDAGFSREAIDSLNPAQALIFDMLLFHTRAECNEGFQRSLNEGMLSTRPMDDDEITEQQRQQYAIEDRVISGINQGLTTFFKRIYPQAYSILFSEKLIERANSYDPNTPERNFFTQIINQIEKNKSDIEYSNRLIGAALCIDQLLQLQSQVGLTEFKRLCGIEVNPNQLMDLIKTEPHGLASLKIITSSMQTVVKALNTPNFETIHNFESIAIELASQHDPKSNALINQQTKFNLLQRILNLSTSAKEELNTAFGQQENSSPLSVLAERMNDHTKDDPQWERTIAAVHYFLTINELQNSAQHLALLTDAKALTTQFGDSSHGPSSKDYEVIAVLLSEGIQQNSPKKRELASAYIQYFNLIQFLRQNTVTGNSVAQAVAQELLDELKTLKDSLNNTGNVADQLKDYKTTLFPLIESARPRIELARLQGEIIELNPSMRDSNQSLLADVDSFVTPLTLDEQKKYVPELITALRDAQESLQFGSVTKANRALLLIQYFKAERALVEEINNYETNHPNEPDAAQKKQALETKLAAIQADRNTPIHTQGGIRINFESFEDKMSSLTQRVEELALEAQYTQALEELKKNIAETVGISSEFAPLNKLGQQIVTLAANLKKTADAEIGRGKIPQTPVHEITKQLKLDAEIFKPGMKPADRLAAVQSSFNNAERMSEGKKNPAKKWPKILAIVFGIVLILGAIALGLATAGVGSVFATVALAIAAKIMVPTLAASATLGVVSIALPAISLFNHRKSIETGYKESLSKIKAEVNKLPEPNPQGVAINPPATPATVLGAEVPEAQPVAREPGAGAGDGLGLHTPAGGALGITADTDSALGDSSTDDEDASQNSQEVSPRHSPVLPTDSDTANDTQQLNKIKDDGIDIDEPANGPIVG